MIPDDLTDGKIKTKNKKFYRQNTSLKRVCAAPSSAFWKWQVTCLTD
jgi:hypothetical protein